MVLTIRARVNEGVTSAGIGFPESVRVDGAQFLSRDAVQEIAQEAVDSLYGEYESGFVAVVNIDRWNDYKGGRTDSGFIIPVVRV